MASLVPRRRRPSPRRGAVLVLVAVMSSGLVAMGALVINWAYIELTNTQLRSAADAAAKAAVVSLSQTQDEALARVAARDIGSRFRVGGQTLNLADGDIEFGNATPDGAGGFVYTPNAAPRNSARVVARVGDGSSTAAVRAVFANLLPVDEFGLAKEAVAGRYDHDICIVVDRSASMAWDLTGVDFSYPSTFNDDSTLQNYFREPFLGYDASEPDPLKRQSRWGALLDALATFKGVVDRRDLNPQVALVSYASNYTFANFSATRSSRDQKLDPDTLKFLDAAHRLGEKPIIGDTNIKAGMDRAKTVLTSNPERRDTANRTMILLSDGRRTEGGDPVVGAEQAAAQRITIHTISFGDGADQAVMAQIAQVGNGSHYHANTGPELQAAFEQIAEELPAVLIR
ncbi:VWA domain-containing protein [Botrimarina sp.]|uniref:vWA domain-containing protein n=1 Tax=Botrimarina sp. TaxID=2795802 RepID=UPI0032EFDE8B